MSMQIGMFTSGYQRNPLEHCFQDAKEYGYDFIELWGGRPHAYAPDLKAGDINEVRRLIDQYEMPVRGYTPEHNAYPYNYMIGSEAQREDAVNYLKLCLDMAKEMDCAACGGCDDAGHTASDPDCAEEAPRIMRNETLLGKLDRPVENTLSPFLVELIPPDSGALVESLKKRNRYG